MTVEVTSTTSPDISAHLQDSGEQLKNPSAQTIYWGIKLDRDLIETIQSIYPEWFKGYDLSKIMDSCKKAELTKTDGGTTVPSSKEASSTCLKEMSAEGNGEDSSIGKTLGKNKETLKVKLMLRRPINELIDQGIMPTFKVPSGFQEQKKLLDRSKDCEALKHKLQHGQVKQELCNQHLTEDSDADPDLQDMERQLKRAKLADPAKDNIIHKTIEVPKGYLQTDKDLVDAINGGMLTFSKTTNTTADGLHVKVEVAEDPSNSSIESTSCPPLVQPDTSGAVPGFKRVNVFPQQLLSKVDQQSVVVNGDITSLANVTVPSSVQITTVSTTSSFLSAQACATYSGNSQNNRLCKKKTSLSSPAQKQSSQSKSQSSKAKTTTASSQPTFQSFQFHEYKGPPNSQKNSSGSNSQSSTTTTTVSPLSFGTSSTESSAYELLLQQQQLFLQWQLEWQNKYPQVVVPQAVKPVQVEKPATGDDNGATPSFVTSTTSIQHENMIPLNTTTPTTSPTEKEMSPPRCLTGMKLDDLRVSDLRAELKKRSLPVSGSKPQLIERLKPFTDGLSTDKDQASDTPSNTATLAKTKANDRTTKDRVTPVSPDSQQLMSPSAVSRGCHSATPVSPDSSAVETISTTQAANIIINGNTNVLKSPVLKSPRSPVSNQEIPLRYSNGEGSFSAASLKRTLSSEFHCPASTPMEVDSTTNAMEKWSLRRRS